MGWDNQLRTTVHAEMVNEFAWRAIEVCRPQDESERSNGTYYERRWFDV